MIMLWCSIQEIRAEKSRMVMEALCAGWREPAQCINGDPPDDDNPFAIYGQVWGAERLLPTAIRRKRPFWYIDNGYWKPGRGGPHGYYRVTYRGMAPVFLKDSAIDRAQSMNARMMPWRRSGRHILFALPGREYGSAIGLNMADWIIRSRRHLAGRTSRPIKERDKWCPRPLEHDLRDCWAVVTHSSNVAVDAVIAGIPVFVESGSPAAPVGNLSLDALETPVMPDRDAWWSSLMSQQFTLQEMRDGTAYKLLDLVRKQVDAVEMN
jgi:hypothetical protein